MAIYDIIGNQTPSIPTFAGSLGCPCFLARWKGPNLAICLVELLDKGIRDSKSVRSMHCEFPLGQGSHEGH